MDSDSVESLMLTVNSINVFLDVSPSSWRDHLQTIRNITVSLDFGDPSPDEARKRWQLPLIRILQRVAFADADNGYVQDIADWCLRQSLALIQLYPTDANILELIGRNWLSRAQKSLANVFRDQGSSSSEGSTHARHERQSKVFFDAEERLAAPDYVEARGLLQPATEYLGRAVDMGTAQGNTTGALLSTAAEAYMSLGNVTSSRFNDRYFEQALKYLRAAADLPGYTLIQHLQHYLDEVGPLYLPA